MCKWDERYINLAKEVASWSKDPSRKIGAVAIGHKGQVLAQGYNGFPRGIDDNEERLNNREVKYQYVVHAEKNMIYNATFNGVSLDGSTVYVSGLPVCSECAKGLIQVGVKKIVMEEIKDLPPIWESHFDVTKKMLDEVGISYKIIKMEGKERK